MIRIFEKKKFVMAQILEEINHAPTSTDSFFKPLLNAAVGNSKSVIVNCSGISALPESCIDSFLFMDQQLKSLGKHFLFVYASGALKQSIETNAKARAFKYADGLLEAIQSLGESRADLSSRQFIKAFINSATRTFYVQAQTQSKRKSIQVKEVDKERPLGDLSGIIRVGATELAYCVMLSFPEATFLKTMSRMLGEDQISINQENQDGAAELLNIIFGQAKVLLNMQGAGLKPQIPYLVFTKDFKGIPYQTESGENHPSVDLATGKTIVITFETDFGNFYIEVWMPAGASDNVFGTS